MHSAAGMPHTQPRSSRAPVPTLFPSRPLDRPFYPLELVDYTVKPAEVMKIAGQPLMRTAEGKWLLVDHADVAIRETDD